MKKPFCTFLLLFCVIAFARATMTSSEITTFPTEAKLTGDKVFVRSEPSTQSQRLTNLAINSVVTVLVPGEAHDTPREAVEPQIPLHLRIQLRPRI